MYGILFEAFAYIGVVTLIGVCVGLLVACINDARRMIRYYKREKQAAEWLGKWGA